jgi:Lipocalin-like domain
MEKLLGSAGLRWGVRAGYLWSVEMLRLAIICGLLFIQQAWSQSMTPSKDQIVGTWRLVAASATSGSIRNDAPYGPTPSGLITYTDDGRVMAIICHSGRKPLASGDRISASTEERAEAFATSFSYAGRYSISNDKIIHRVELASVQNWVDTDLIRLARVDGDRITLTTPAISVGGEIRTTELIWERIR